MVKVIDFGIAKATQGKLTDQTPSSRALNSSSARPVYMAPEQAAMSGVDIDTRSDIYSLGVLLYELLAGKPPFDSKTLISAGYDEMRRIIREDEPPKPSTRLTEARSAASADSKLHVPYSAFPNELDWIVMKAIEKDRARRYGTASEFAMDIGRHLANEPVSAARPSATYRLRKYVRRNRGLVTSLAAVFTVLAIGVIGMTILFAEMRAQKNVAVSKGEEAKISKEAAEHNALLLAEQKNAAAAQSEIWKQRAYTANVMRAHHFWKEQQAGRAREVLEACPEELRNWEWHWLWQLVDRNELVAEGLRGLLGAWFTPDGRSVLSYRSVHTVGEHSWQHGRNLPTLGQDQRRGEIQCGRGGILGWLGRLAGDRWRVYQGWKGDFSRRDKRRRALGSCHRRTARILRQGLFSQRGERVQYRISLDTGARHWPRHGNRRLVPNP